MAITREEAAELHRAFLGARKAKRIRTVALQSARDAVVEAAKAEVRASDAVDALGKEAVPEGLDVYSIRRETSVRALIALEEQT